ncbi:MAG: hypothetical protein HXX08_15580 [Chloroflexi bacterium]|uniref:Tetratricopeptide repeat protein n=1 Tax=Candidatus Chlorohelix allophototropha TaxID=3003348 RepID=A0A8T7M5C7_9CHLR|nr:hypothetical protein [Chloroflexota bacterium]WJW69201.1 hypothetical protein OZ401_002797 [Chloroflexota bacterium L227-S17]
MDEQIKQAIEADNIEEARRLIREALQNNPTADTYYYAARVALNDQQRESFLKKALELDPWHELAANELEKLSSRQLAPLMEYTPTVANPASLEIQTAIPTVTATVVHKKGVPVWTWLMMGVAVMVVAGVIIGALAVVSSNNQNVSATATAEAYKLAATATASVPTPTPKPVVIARSVGCLPEITDKTYTTEPMMQVCVTPKNPGQYSDVTVYARILQKRQPTSGLGAYAYFNYRYFPASLNSLTDADGIARIRVNTGVITVDYPVRVDITFFDSSGKKIQYTPKADENIFTPE